MLQEEAEDEGNEVHINHLHDDQSWFNPRAKCYPLYSLMLAVNRTDIDLLSLGAQGQELDVSAHIRIPCHFEYYSAIYSTESITF